MKSLQIAALVVILFASLVFGWNQADQLYRRHWQDKAVAWCMSYGIPDGVVIDGEYYCIITVTQSAFTIRFAYSPQMMIDLFGVPE